MIKMSLLDKIQAPQIKQNIKDNSYSQAMDEKLIKKAD